MRKKARRRCRSPGTGGAGRRRPGMGSADKRQPGTGRRSRLDGDLSREHSSDLDQKIERRSSKSGSTTCRKKEKKATGQRSDTGGIGNNGSSTELWRAWERAKPML